MLGDVGGPAGLGGPCGLCLSKDIILHFMGNCWQVCIKGVASNLSSLLYGQSTLESRGGSEIKRGAGRLLLYLVGAGSCGDYMRVRICNTWTRIVGVECEEREKYSILSFSRNNQESSSAVYYNERTWRIDLGAKVGTQFWVSVRSLLDIVVTI